MNRQQLKRLARGYKTLMNVLHWRELYRYVNAGVGLELLQFEDTTPTQTVLVLAPHPDDEVFGCGGTLALHRRHGDEVTVIYLTDGSRGTASGRPDKALIAIREQEAQSGLKVLGDMKSHFWRFADGKFEVNKTTIGLLREVIESIKPDVIYVPWFGDDHEDHFTVVPLMVEVLPLLKDHLKFEIRQYELWAPLVPNRLVKIGDVLEQKLHAMEAHHSQLASRSYRDGILGLNTYRGALAGFDEPAEAYFALNSERFLHFCQHIITLKDN